MSCCWHRGKRSRHRAGEIVGQGGRAYRLDVPSRRVTAPSRVLDLAEQAAVARFDRIGPALQAVELAVIDGALVIRPVAPPPLSLEELLRGVTDDNIPGEWDTGPATGKEVW